MPTNAELAKEIDALRSEVAAMRDSLQTFNALYESVKTRNEALAKENKALRDENKSVKDDCRLFSRRLADVEQYSRANNVEIKGIPKTEGESCLAVVQAIGEKVGCAIAPSDIDIAHRVPGKQGTHIIARFCSRSKKTDFAVKARKARLNTRAIGLSGNSVAPIYVNDHLTPENKRLFAQALELKKAKGWKFLWTDNCIIKARKSEDSRVHRISGVGDLAVFK